MRLAHALKQLRPDVAFVSRVADAVGYCADTPANEATRFRGVLVAAEGDTAQAAGENWLALANELLPVAGMVVVRCEPQIELWRGFTSRVDTWRAYARYAVPYAEPK